MGPDCHQYIVEHCKNHPFSLGIDGSSDTDVKKMNPVTIKLFDMDKSKCVTNHFYDMCVTSGCDTSKAEEIFNTVEEKFRADSIPWANAVSLSVPLHLGVGKEIQIFLLVVAPVIWCT